MKTDLEYKTDQHNESLKRLKENPRVAKVRVSAPQDCSFGQSIQGVFDKDDAPALPGKGCSRPGGCICTYEPVLDVLYP
jgi:hypothetical protein